MDKDTKRIMYNLRCKSLSDPKALLDPPSLRVVLYNMLDFIARPERYTDVYLDILEEQIVEIQCIQNLLVEAFDFARERQKNEQHTK